jgi:hypothetical protein
MAETELSEESQILRLGKTPTQWIKAMARLGINIAERTLRKRANATGAFHRLGRTMLITPAQIDTIFEGVPSCHSKSIKGGTISGRRGGSNTMVGQSQVHTGAALEHLQKQAHRTG